MCAGERAALAFRSPKILSSRAKPRDPRRLCNASERRFSSGSRGCVGGPSASLGATLEFQIPSASCCPLRPQSVTSSPPMKLATFKTAAATAADRRHPRRQPLRRGQGGAPTLQAALDDWAKVRAAPAREQPRGWRQSGGGWPLDAKLAAPLPRAYEWVDGSAFLNHVILVRKARGAEPPPRRSRTDPLVYQGGSGVLLGPTEDIALPDESWGLDFESEVCVDPRRHAAGHARPTAPRRHVKLVLLANDVTLRNLVPDELAKSFGFFQSQAGDGVLALRGHARRARRRWRDGRVAPARCARPTTASSSATPRRARDALLLLRARRAHREDARLHRRHHPRQRDGLQRRPRARHLAAWPSGA